MSDSEYLRIPKGHYEMLVEKVNTLGRENNVLKSALDKTCERLSEYSVITLGGEDFCYRTDEEWKKWAKGENE